MPVFRLVISRRSSYSILACTFWLGFTFGGRFTLFLITAEGGKFAIALDQSSGKPKSIPV
tara:strand:+ start:146 stop:325 length:180 start_codon:yes stop_codon:yes gene_type:complete